MKKPTEKHSASDVVANAIIGTLTTLRKGRTVTELTESLQELVGAVRKTGKPGVLTLKVRVEPAGKADDSIVIVSDDVSVKLPKMQTVATVMYANDENLLQRDNPNQAEMKLTPISGGKLREKIEPVTPQTKEVANAR